MNSGRLLLTPCPPFDGSGDEDAHIAALVAAMPPMTTEALTVVYDLVHADAVMVNRAA